VASERDDAQRAAFRAVVAPLDQRRFIFVDETSTNLAMTRRYARAPRGQRVYGAVPRNHGRNLSVIGALGLRGMVAALSVEGAVDTDVFDVFVRQVLVPALRPGDIVLLDNLNVHHASCITQAVQTAQGQVIFLPSYSPDFSPIEPCWSKVKTFLRGAAARTRRRLESALKSALLTICPEDIRGWFTHCGYLVPSK
jgi:transposase